MKHVVLDFDCTLSAHHLWKTMHAAPDPQREALLAVCDDEQMDTQSQQFVALLRAGHTVLFPVKHGLAEWSNGATTPSFARCTDLVDRLFGGEKRLRRLSRFLERITRNKAVAHISTHGVASVVAEVLHAAGLRPYFTYIHGRDDVYQDDVVLRFGEASRRRNSHGVHPAETVYDGKFEFMCALATDAPVLYADDSDDYLEEVADHTRIWWLPGLPTEGSGLQPSHLKALEAQLHQSPGHWPMYPDPIETSSAVVVLPIQGDTSWSKERGPQALIVLLDVSSSMDSHGRIENARKAIAAVAPRYASGGVFLLPWSHREHPLVQLHHPNDEEEVARQLAASISVGGGTSYRAAAQSLLSNAGAIAGRIPDAADADVKVLFITDSDSGNDERINFDSVADSVRKDLGERVKSLALAGINVYGEFRGESEFRRVEEVFASFRREGVADETWCTIRSTSEVDTRIRAILGARAVVVRVEVLGATDPGVTVRVSGGSGANTGFGSTPLSETLADRKHLVLIVSRPVQSGAPPTELTVRVSLPEPTTYRLKLRARVRPSHRDTYTQRMFQSVRTNVLESVEEDLMADGSGFGVDPHYVDQTLAPAFRALEQEHAELMESLEIRASDRSTRYIFQRWSELLAETRGKLASRHSQEYRPVPALIDPGTLRHRIAALRQQREQLGAVPPSAPLADPPVFASVYVRRKKNRPTPYPPVQLGVLDRELARLEQQLVYAEEAARESARESAPVPPHQVVHRYIPRRYMSSAHRPRGPVDFSRYTRVQGECDICYSVPVNLYTYTCCSKTICGNCGVNLTDRCPFCRASPTSFV